ncbi:MAG TPA: ABC transporter substrate-binding protein, partial [Polyangiales bacterium]|nr:ABC transporter substrate-binding protein [Polyangiales bacterium]
MGTRRTMIALLFLLFGCPAAARGPDIGRLPVLTSDDPSAEVELRDADAQRSQGNLDDAATRYRAFLDKRPSDRLRPIAELALGRILLDQQKNDAALALFDSVARHPDSAVAEQGRFYGGVAHARLGHDAQAIDSLAPMVGRTVEPNDTVLLLSALADAYARSGRVADAVITLQTLSEDNVPDSDRRAARTRIVTLVDEKASPADIRRLFDELDHGGYAWRHVALRAVRDADAAHDVDRTRTLLDALKDENVPFDDALAAIAIRAERPSDANPAAVGAILSLSGRARKVGELALRGLMLAAGLPPQGPPAANAPQLVLRDDGLDPATAVTAVNELVSVHRVIAIIGPMDAQVAQAAGKRAQELGVPLIALTPGGALPSIGPMVFRYFPTPQTETHVLVAAARAQGAQRVAILYPQSAYGEALRAAFEHEAGAVGLTVAAAQSYASGATSFGSESSALAKVSFDALFV